jgi:hypothetical protein
MTSVKSGVGGWLLVLAVILLVWQPLSFALVAASLLDAVMIRGLSAAIVLGVRVIVTALGIAAGLAILGRRAGAVAIATASLVASAATDVFVYTTSYFPSNRPPDETMLLVAGSVAWYAVWLAYLGRSKRVRSTF